MKKMLCLLAFMPLVAFGQFSKGTKSIGGLMLYNANKADNYGGNQPPTTYFSIDSQIGFF